MPGGGLSARSPKMTVAQAHALITAPSEPLAVEDAEIGGVTLRTWKNLPASLREVVQLARDRGDRTFIVHEGERVSFDAFFRATSAFAHLLRAAGIRKGDRVAILMRNLPEWPVCFYGAAVLGAIATPLNAWSTASELEYMLKDCGASLVVLDDERWRRLEGRLGPGGALLQTIVCRSAGPCPGALRLEDLLGAPRAWAELPDRPLPWVELQPDDDATIFYTSGTTGRPKGAIGTHRSMNTVLFTAAAVSARQALRQGLTLPPVMNAGPQRAFLLSVPLFHVTGCMATLHAALFQGHKLVLTPKWDVVRAFELIEAERINQVGGVPTILWQLIEHPARGDHDLSSVDMLSYGGAPAPPELVRRITEAFPAATPNQGWGMTETCSTVTSNRGDDYLRRPDSCGVAAAVAEIEVRDPVDGCTVLPVGDVGELWSRGPMNCRGYWNNPDATAQTFVDGWVRTGDMARVDEEGFCFIIDRARDMLIRGGENIYCVEVENALYDHPAVIDAAVVGRDHRTLGEEPVAVVTLKAASGCTPEELRVHVSERLARYKVPVEIRVSEAALPRNANGKILKAELKQLFATTPAG